MKIHIIVYILLLVALVGCGKSETQEVNITQIINQVSACVSEKSVLQTKYNTLDVTYKNLKQEHLELKNITLASYPKNISTTNELIDRIEYLEKLNEDCYFYNETEREEQLKEELEEYEDDIEDLEDDLEECEDELDECEDNLSDC